MVSPTLSPPRAHNIILCKISATHSRHASHLPLPPLPPLLFLQLCEILLHKISICGWTTAHIFLTHSTTFFSYLITLPFGTHQPFRGSCVGFHIKKKSRAGRKKKNTRWRAFQAQFIYLSWGVFYPQTPTKKKKIKKSLEIWQIVIHLSDKMT